MKTTDPIWINIRYALIAVGVSLATHYLHGWLPAEQVASIVSPLVDVIIGVTIAGGTVIWGNYVRAGTVAVPADTAARPDVPTVSAATGKVTPADN